MNLSDLPQFTIATIRRGSDNGDAVLIGRLSHLTGVRDTTAWLFRSATGSLIGTIDRVPVSADETIAFETQDLALAPELCVGATYPWIDGTWQAYQVAMILRGQWTKRTFTSEPARYFRFAGTIGWQPLDLPLFEGAEDLGIREGAWDHEHCDLCNARIGKSGVSDGFVDPDDHWLCPECYGRYAVHQDVSFVAEA